MGPGPAEDGWLPSGHARAWYGVMVDGAGSKPEPPAAGTSAARYADADVFRCDPAYAEVDAGPGSAWSLPAV